MALFDSRTEQLVWSFQKYLFCSVSFEGRVELYAVGDESVVCIVDGSRSLRVALTSSHTLLKVHSNMLV